MDDPRIVTDPGTGRPVLVAPGRSGRPRHTAPDADAGACPFCTGREQDTPPERDAIRRDGSAPDTPGWRARVFENLYPALPWHEVFAEGPAHETQPGRLDRALWQDVLELYRRRIAHMESQPSVACAFWVKNVGLEAGASMTHNHSQLFGLPMMPPRLEAELSGLARGGCAVCRLLEHAERDGRLIVAGEHHSAFSPREPKLPFETWLAPHAHAPDFLSGENAHDLADVLARLYRAVDAAFDSPPFNAWLHRVPGEDFHWHLELQPRTGYVAGLELGADVYVNAIPPETAARRLREAAR